MYQPTLPDPKPTLREVQERFEAWRQARPKRASIPDELWQAAISACQDHSINKVSKTLRLNYTDLRHRVRACDLRPSAPTAHAPTFIELEWDKPLAASECIVEMQDQQGAQMKMTFKGDIGLDLLELSKAFWSKPS